MGSFTRYVVLAAVLLSGTVVASCGGPAVPKPELSWGTRTVVPRVIRQGVVPHSLHVVNGFAVWAEYDVREGTRIMINRSGGAPQKMAVLDQALPIPGPAQEVYLFSCDEVDGSRVGTYRKLGEESFDLAKARWPEDRVACAEVIFDTNGNAYAITERGVVKSDLSAQTQVLVSREALDERGWQLATLLGVDRSGSILFGFGNTALGFQEIVRSNSHGRLIRVFENDGRDAIVDAALLPNGEVIIAANR